MAKEGVEIPCPEAVLEYNRHMGGVDKLDFVLSLYPNASGQKKWTVRVSSHFASLAVANSWLEYLRDANQEKLPRSKAHDTLSFQTKVALCLIQQNTTAQRKRGQPSSGSVQPLKQRTHNTCPLPPNAVRFDRPDNWPQHEQLSFSQRCKLEGCTSKARVRCRKCDVLFLDKQNECLFLPFSQCVVLTESTPSFLHE